MDRRKRASLPAIRLERVIEGNINPGLIVEENYFPGRRRRSDAFSFSGHDDRDPYIKKESLVSTTVQVVRLKDFAAEFRCKRDVDIFVKNARIILDCEELDLESIISKMLLVSMSGND